MSYWIWTIIFLCTITPVGVIMLMLKLFGGEGKKKNVSGRHPYYTQSAQSNPGARTVSQSGGGQQTASQIKAEAKAQAKSATAQAKGQAKAEKKKADPLKIKVDQAKTLITVGTVLAAVFGMMALAIGFENLYYSLTWFLDEVIFALTGFGAGIGLLWAGLRRQKKLRRYRKYLSMIGSRQAMSITSLADAMGRSTNATTRDLEDMLDDEIFKTGYINYGRDMLVLSEDGLWDAPPAKAAEEKKPEETLSEENAVLQEIRAVNDAIDHPKLSEQIDRIGLITAKIFDYQKQNPEKAPQLHSFLSYYLPTTLKILRAYAQLEAQEVEGSNINASMARIEGMMDKVVEGFEKQLDQLFQSNAMDIATDVKVLEQMLAKDGLVEGDMIRLEL